MDELQRVRHLELQSNQAWRSLARTLKSKRTALKLTLEEAGKSVKVVPSTVMRIEKGTTRNLKTAEKLARLYEKLAA